MRFLGYPFLTLNYDEIKEITCPNDVVLKYDYDLAGRLATVNCDGTYELKLPMTLKTVWSSLHRCRQANKGAYLKASGPGLVKVTSGVIDWLEL
jgi:hypothetical protein